MQEYWWDEPERYRKVQRKRYAVQIFKPLEEAYCINFLEQPYWARYFGISFVDCADARDWFDNLKPADQYKVRLFLQAGIMYKCGGKTDTQKSVVVNGTEFENWCIDYTTLSRDYTLAGGKPITESVIEQLEQGTRERVNYRMQVFAKPNTENLCACYVPLNIRGEVACENIQMPVNSTLLSLSYHGNGDFVVAPMDKNGKPDMTKRRVVVGKVFENTFNNRGWQKYLSK